MKSRKTRGDGPDSARTGKPDGNRNAYVSALWGLKSTLVTLLCFSAILNVLMLTGSVYMLQIYDRVLSSGSLDTLMGLFTIVVVLFVFLGFFDFIRTRILSRAALRLDDVAAPAALDLWIRSGLPGAPDRAGQALRDLGTVRGFIASPAMAGFFDVPFIPLYLTVLFMIHPWLGWLTVAGAVVTAIIALTTRAMTAGSLRRAAGLDAAERDFADSSHANAEAITAMGMQETVTRRWSDLHVDAMASGQRGSDPSEILAASSKAFRMLLQSSILTLGALLVLRGDISGGMIIASSILSGRALAPVDQLIGQWRNIGRTLAAHARLMSEFKAAPIQPARITLPAPTGRIQVSNLTRLAPAAAGSAATDRARILTRISFDLDPGDGLGVIGNSASGKSTLARLLIGATRPDAGEIRLDGATQDQWDPAVLGRHIGYLPQTLTLLPGTIRDNIARFDPQAADEDVIAAARLTGIHDMILKLPDGYATRVGATGGGMALSGGQIQRVGLARAIYRMPALVVLDEPNSNLDVAGDSALIRTVEALREAGSTVVVMAHRPSAIAAVNKLMVLEGGKVQLFGNKAEVLKAAMKSGAGGGAKLPGLAPERPRTTTDVPHVPVNDNTDKRTSA